MIKYQNVYEISGLDFEVTYNKIPRAIRERAGRKPQVDVGAISFTLPSTKIKARIFPKGPPYRMQVEWRSHKEKETYLPKIKELLVPMEGKEVRITPLHASIMKIPFPAPLTLMPAWCRNKVLYVAPIQLAKALSISFAFAILFIFELFCQWPLFGFPGGWILAFILTNIVWVSFERKFGHLASLVGELTKSL